MNRILRPLLKLLCSVLLVSPFLSAGLHAQETPDALVRRVSTEALDRIRADKDIQSGDLRKLSEFVDGSVMPHVNFQRMTAAAVGPGWRQATPEQQKRLQEEFKTLLVRT